MKTKLLILSPFLPWPLNSGGNIGVFNMLKAVAKDLDVHFVTSMNQINTISNASELNSLIPEIKIHLYDWKSAKNKKFEFLRKFVRRLQQKMNFAQNINSLSFNLNDEFTPDFIDFVNTVITENRINIVQVEFCSYLPWVYCLHQKVKKIFIHHELRYVRDEQAYVANPYGRYLIDFAKDNEISMLNRFDKVVTLTSVDKQKLEEEGVNVPIEVSTLAISDTTPELKIGSSSNCLSFVGGSGHFPNYDGMKWFAKEVLPLVSREIPDIKLQVIGSWSEETKEEILSMSSAIEFKGFVPNLNDGIKNTLMIVPINIGSGMRMKILEAASNSVPFVSTVVGVEGLDFENEKDCLIAKSAEEMAQQIVRVLKDSALYSSLAENAYYTFVNKYSFEAMKRTRLGIY